MVICVMLVTRVSKCFVLTRFFKTPIFLAFMNSAECLMELDQRPSVKHCHDETLRDIERANGEHGITMPTKLDRMCE